MPAPSPIAVNALVACLLLASCGPSRPTDAASTQAEEETTNGGDGDGDTQPGDGDGDTQPGDGDGDTQPGDGDGDGDPLPGDCPPPLPVRADFSVDPPTPIQSACTRAGESIDDSGIYELLLDCEGAAVSVTLDSTIPYLPSPSETLSIDYRVEGAQRWLALHMATGDGPGALVLGAVSATQLAPPGTSSSEFFVEPWLAIADEQACEDPLEQPCGDALRMSLVLSSEQFGELGPVADAQSFLVNFLAFGYAVEVERALHYLDAEACGASESFELVMTWFSDP